jgi:hypothetical protein
MRFTRTAGAAVAVALIATSASGALAGPTPTKQSSSAVETWGPDRTPGVPPGGPAALYAPPPKLAMTSNHDARFRAPFAYASGVERYVDGEYVYTGYAYDDEETVYPDDPTMKRYANNSANLVEFRIAPYSGGTLYRFTFNTLLQKDTTIATVAFDTDRKATTGTSTLPKDPGLPFPGTDQALTTWGTGAQWSTWTGNAWRHVTLKHKTDLAANQITIEVPHSVVEPSGSWQATLATGICDAATKGWLDVKANSRNTTNIVNLGFRFNETRLVGSDPTGYNHAPWANQSAALKAGRTTDFKHTLRFDWLAKGKSYDNIPTRGPFIRMAPSFLAGGTANEGDVPAGISALDDNGFVNPKYRFYTEGAKRRGSFASQYYSPLQPYVIYIPEHYEPGKPTRLTFWLHPEGGEYYGFASTFDIPKVWGDARNSIMIDPLARSYHNFHQEEQEQGLFEAWNDVARHYTLDPDRTIISGGSGGGFGSLNAGAKWPHLFAGVAAFVPAGQKGLYIPGVSDGPHKLNDWLPNFRNLPIYVVSDMFSELTFYPGPVQNMIGPSALGNSMEQLKYRYLFKSVAKDHLLIDFDRPHVATWMGDRKIEQKPFHVTYVRQPSNDTPQAGIVHNQAYWLSNIEIRDTSARVAKGQIDAVSHGFGLTEADTKLETPVVGVDNVATANAYFTVERTWGPFKPAPRKDRLAVNATNIRAVTIDPKAARITCHTKLEIHSDGPIKVTLKGCPRR